MSILGRLLTTASIIEKLLVIVLVLLLLWLLSRFGPMFLEALSAAG